MKKSTKHLPRESLGDSYNSVWFGSDWPYFWSSKKNHNKRFGEFEYFGGSDVMNKLQAWKMRTPRSHCFSSHMSNRQLWQLKKSKSRGPFWSYGATKACPHQDFFHSSAPTLLISNWFLQFKSCCCCWFSKFFMVLQGFFLSLLTFFYVVNKEFHLVHLLRFSE